MFLIMRLVVWFREASFSLGNDAFENAWWFENIAKKSREATWNPKEITEVSIDHNFLSWIPSQMIPHWNVALWPLAGNE